MNQFKTVVKSKTLLYLILSFLTLALLIYSLIHNPKKSYSLHLKIQYDNNVIEKPTNRDYKPSISYEALQGEFYSERVLKNDSNSFYSTELPDFYSSEIIISPETLPVNFHIEDLFIFDNANKEKIALKNNIIISRSSNVSDNLDGTYKINNQDPKLVYSVPLNKISIPSGIGISFIFICLSLIGLVYFIYVQYQIYQIQKDFGTSIIFLGLIFFGIINIWTISTSYPPDEAAHISYINFFQNNFSLFPKIENAQMNFGDNNFNYLQHPPHYYLLMASLNKKVIVAQDVGTIRLMRLFNLLIALIGLSWTCIALCRLNIPKALYFFSISIFFLFPSLILNMSFINNDAFNYLTIGLLSQSMMAIFFKDFNSLFTKIFLAFIIAAMTKLTSLLIVILFVVFIIMPWLLLKRQKLLFKDIFILISSKKNIILSLLLVLPLSSLIYYQFNYGTITPSAKKYHQQLDLDYQKSLRPPTGKHKDLSFYLDYFFFKRLKGSFNGFTAHLKLDQKFTIFTFLQISYFWAFSALFLIALLALYKANIPLRINIIMWFCGIALMVTAFLIIHIYKLYTGYLGNGYSGGMQARYYFPVIGVIIGFYSILQKSLYDNIKKLFFLISMVVNVFLIVGLFLGWVQIVLFLVRTF